VNIIQKLESLQQQLVGDGLVVQAVDLQNIIEEYKATAQKPVEVSGLKSRMKQCCEHAAEYFDTEYYQQACARVNLAFSQLFPGATYIFTHPQLSDETVKDAERYRWLRNESWAGYNSGKSKPQVAETIVFVQRHGTVETVLAEEALDLAIDEAMKATNELPK